MNAHTIEFAKECGYAGSSPSMLDAFEQVRRHGIEQARRSHHDRKRITDAIKTDPDLISAMIHPAQSVDEALQDIAAFLLACRNMPSWRRQNHAAAIRKARANRLYFRFFRRFGARLMARAAA